MDSLALLCTLHADGPATLRRLRKGGCQSLVDLQRVGADGIASMLSIPPAVARRLVREGRMLNERVGGDSLDAEEAPDGMAVAVLGNAQAPLTEGAELDDRDRDLIRQVLGDARPVHGFRSRNGVGEVPNLSLPVDEPMGGAFTAQEISKADGFSEWVAPGPVPRASQYLLVGRVDGLDADVAAVLSDAGIETLTGLIEADASKLARGTGLSFGPLRRLQFLARKSLQVGGEVSIPATVEPEPAGVLQPELVPEVEGPVATFVLPRPAPFSDLQAAREVQPEQEAVSPMAPSSAAEDPFAKEAWPEARMPLVKELEPEAAGPMADEAPAVETPVAETPRPLGRWMPKEMRAAQSHTTQCDEPEPVLVPPPPPRRFWEPKRFWEARKNRQQAAAGSAGVEGQQESQQARQEKENLQGGNLPPAAGSQAPEKDAAEARVTMPQGKDLGDLRWDFREPQFRPESNGKGGFHFEEPQVQETINPEPHNQEAQGDASGPFA